MKKLNQIIISIFLLSAIQSCQTKDVKTSNPNILIIYADDLGYGDLSCYGGDIPTNIGRVISKLEERKMLNNTIIWFISDNGGYSERFFGHADNGGLRGEKGTLWEGGIKIPALLCWKDKILSEQIINNPLCNIDVLPTLLSILDVPLSEEEKKVFDGLDISPVLFKHQDIERTIFWKYNRETAIRMGKWKLINGKELFDLDTDPNETTDLSGQYKNLVGEMNRKYKEIEQDIMTN